MEYYNNIWIISYIYIIGFIDSPVIWVDRKISISSPTPYFVTEHLKVFIKSGESDPQVIKHVRYKLDKLNNLDLNRISRIVAFPYGYT